MSGLSSFDYAWVRVVPFVEREEFINAGVIVHCRTRRFLGACIQFDAARLHALAPGLDPAPVERQLTMIPAICAGGPDSGPIGKLPILERFDWLVARSSTMIQTSPVHCGLTDDPAATLEHLAGMLALA